ncbi:major facilitator superfamily domain-containing protein [Circinella umbellata]|nr:major facilitator superfamily domain-containing protein [Circinella umbellata]
MSKKSAILAIVSLSAAINPFSTSIYYPAVVDIQAALDTTDTAINASLGVFIFATACFPLLWAILSERYGSRPIYLISFFICVVVNICCALSVNIAMLIAFQGVSAIGSSALTGVGGGTIADIFEPHQRGRAFASYNAGVLLGPTISPIIGGYLNEGFGWRVIFWFLSIVVLFIWLGILLILPETKRPQSVESKKANVQEEYKSAQEEEICSSIVTANSNQEKKKLNLNRLLGPLQFFRFPNVTLSTVFVGILFFTCYILNTNLARIYTYQYGLDSGKVGLCYIPLAIGGVLGGLVGGKYSDVAYKKQTEKGKNKDEIQAEMRLVTPIFYASIILSLFSFIAFGWCIQANVHYAAGLVCVFFVGFSLVIPVVIVMAYFMDCFSRQCSSVLACNNLVRFIMGGIGSLTASDIQRAFGPAILYGVCGGIIVLVSGNIIIIRIKGKKWAIKRKEAGI